MTGTAMGGPAGVGPAGINTQASRRRDLSLPGRFFIVPTQGLIAPIDAKCQQIWAPMDQLEREGKALT